MKIHPLNTRIPTLGPPRLPSPLTRRMSGGYTQRFISDRQRVLFCLDPEKTARTLSSGNPLDSFETAGPREQIYFDPAELRCAIVTCGGLCPGLNDIIRSIFLELHHCYGVRRIMGIPYGLQGFIPEYGHALVQLTPEYVSHILDMGGTVLGSSRGAQDMDAIVSRLEEMRIGILFMVGGDGTLMAARKITETISARGLDTSVIVIPKTIDNDIHLVSRSFGFDTAVDIATDVIKGAHNEAAGYPNGIGLIKLMGRHSGFLAATAALAQQDANFVIIPEIDFDLEGPSGLLSALETRLATRKHAVIVVAEGAGQKFFTEQPAAYDPSGNIRLQDIGLFLKQEITRYFDSRGVEVSLKYIDPSYTIRSLPANANDSIFCGFLGRYAVHAGMAGKTGLLISHWNDRYIHVPMAASAGQRKQLDPQGRLWGSVLEATGQGSLINETAP